MVLIGGVAVDAEDFVVVFLRHGFQESGYRDEESDSGVRIQMAKQGRTLMRPPCAPKPGSQ